MTQKNLVRKKSEPFSFVYLVAFCTTLLQKGAKCLTQIKSLEQVYWIGSIQATLRESGLSGILVAGVPLKELLFAFTFGTL